MMYNWFYIFNTEIFTATGLVSQTYRLLLDGVGQEDVLVTSGKTLGITYDGVFLPLNLNAQNPFAIDGYAIYVNSDNNVFLGIEAG